MDKQMTDEVEIDIDAARHYDYVGS